MKLQPWPASVPALVACVLLSAPPAWGQLPLESPGGEVRATVQTALSAGDADADGRVSLSDLAVVAANWSHGVAAGEAVTFEQALAQVWVPEPTGGLLLFCGALALRNGRKATDDRSGRRCGG